jgi:LysR family transcriptional regulator, hydrogen peroxide-inducible genes activator
MQSYLPSLRQLNYLLVLHELGHFGNAAKACNVTQSTLSASLKELENLMGVQLVERNRRVVRFTSVGELVVEKSRTIISQAQELSELVHMSHEPLSGELRLSVIPTIAPFFLPRALPKLRAQWPKLNIYLREETSAQACDSLHKGRADCVLLALPYACGDVECQILFEDELVMAFPHTAPVILPVLPENIDMDSLLLMEDGHCLKEHALAACNKNATAGRMGMIGTSLHTLVQMVDNGLGHTLLPQMALDAGILHGTQVRTCRIEAPHASRQIALIWRKGVRKKEEYQLLARALMG